MGIGDKVKVRTAGGGERTVRVAQVGDGVVYVTTDEEYQRAVRQGEQPTPYLGFPVQDVQQA